MGGIKFSVHPLFFLLGFYYAITGRISVFIVYTLCALIHEIGHSICAEKKGYKLNKIYLMPFGAVVSGDIDNISPENLSVIALWGPLTNLFIGLFFVALWWIFPIIYAFTDIVVIANFSLALINLLPVFPLDGGRILYAFIARKKGSKKANKICKITGVIFSLILIVLFVLSCFYTVNFSFLFFSLFVLFGAFSKLKENTYVLIFKDINENRLKKGVTVKTVAVSSKILVKDLIKAVDNDYINEIHVYSENKCIKTLYLKDVKNIITTENYEKELHACL